MNQANSVHKIVVDTNIWVSFVMGKLLNSFQWHIHNKNCRIISCTEQINELRDVLFREKMRRYFTRQQADEIVDLLNDTAEFIDITSKIDICRDAADNYLLALVIDSKANFFVTGDNDLLVLQQIDNTRIIKYADFKTIN